MTKLTLREALDKFERREIKVQGVTYKRFVHHESGNMRICFDKLDDQGNRICTISVDFLDDGRIYGTALRDYEDYGDDFDVNELPKSVIRAVNALGKVLFF